MKKRSILSLLACGLALGACATAPAAPPASAAQFDWFEYAGHDGVYNAHPAGAGEYNNPILTGFYPDPAITQVGGDYYLVNSTFSYFPGIPIFHSRDLVNWTQIGNVIDRSGMLNFDGLGISRGVFAPTITHHNGTFYVANTCVDCRGNFIVSATDPAGPWSDPIWLPEIGGIDPSLFFDDDGKVYLMNNDAPPEPPLYSGHRAIWIREVDPTTFQSISEPVVLINGGVRREEHPIWIEGPHIFKRGGYYYLSAAEGGTAEGHSQVILRSRTVLGPYVANPNNPILTQRHLDRGRPEPITSVGHADYVTTPDGQWWASFLGTRPYAGDFYNTGRETFLMPVRWVDDWPVITQGDEQVPYVHARPNLPPQPAAQFPMSGNFTVREDFDRALANHWLFIRAPGDSFVEMANHALLLTPTSQHIGRLQHPSFVGRRQQHMNASASTAMIYAPQGPGDEAGLMAFQNDDFYYFLAVAAENGRRVVQVQRRAGPSESADGIVVASATLAGAADAPVYLKIDARGGRYDFSYGETEGAWIALLRDADGTDLSTRTAGGFVGVVFGLYAYDAP
jgi:alpha-N-arabinofuranosidase